MWQNSLDEMKIDGRFSEFIFSSYFQPYKQNSLIKFVNICITIVKNVYMLNVKELSLPNFKLCIRLEKSFKLAIAFIQLSFIGINSDIQ